MKNNILVGKNGLGENEYLAYEKYETRHVSIVGVSRSGKSNQVENLIKGATELPPDERPNICLIDDQQEFGRIRKYDRDFIIIGGDDGEVPLILSHAREMGRQIRINKLNVIIRITALFEADDRYIFLEELIKGISEVEKKYWFPMWLVIDEAQKYASSKESTARNAIATVASTGLKQGIMLVLASQRLKSVYTDVRTQCLNHIIGLIDDEDDRELACEAMHIPKSEGSMFDKLEAGKGMFFMKGIDMSKHPVLVQCVDMGWRTHDEKYIVYPKISLRGLEQAKKLSDSLVIVHVDKETMLRQEISDLHLKVSSLMESQLDSVTLDRLLNAEYVRGWDDKRKEDDMVINEIREHAQGSMFRKPKTFIIVKKQDHDGKERMKLQ